MKPLARTFLLLFSCLINISLLSAQTNPLDNCQEELVQLEKEMMIRYEEYSKKYQFEGVSYKAITLYEYNKKNELIQEKGIKPADRYYHVSQYEQGRKVRSLNSLLGNKRLELKKYDKLGRETESIECTERTCKTDLFNYKTIEDKKTKQIGETYCNDRLQWRSVRKNLPDRNESLLYRGEDTSVYFKSIEYYSPDKKRMEKFEITNYENAFAEIWNYQYLDTLVTSKTIYNVGKDTTEYRYQYNKKGLEIKEEQYKNGKIEHTTYKEYDTRGNNTLVKCYWGSGNICYISVYEYDSSGNKKAYLYFYCY